MFSVIVPASPEELTDLLEIIFIPNSSAEAARQHASHTTGAERSEYRPFHLNASHNPWRKTAFA
jgi:hypothetical protein